MDGGRLRAPPARKARKAAVSEESEPTLDLLWRDGKFTMPPMGHYDVRSLSPRGVAVRESVRDRVLLECRALEKSARAAVEIGLAWPPCSLQSP